MKEKSSPKINKSVIVIASVVLLIAAGFICWNLFKYKFIKGKVKDVVYEKTNGLYTIRYDKMDLDEVAGYLYVTNLQIIPDTARFRQMMKEEKNPPLLLSLFVPELKIAGVKTPEAMLNKKISGRKLEISNATAIFYYARSRPDTSNAGEQKALYQQLLGNLKEIQADTVEVTHVSLAFLDMATNRKTIEASDISINLKDVLIDSLHNNDSSRFFFSKEVDLVAEKAVVKNKPGTYFYHFDGVHFTNNGSNLAIKSVSIAPQLSEEKFAAFSKLQNDRFNVSFNNITLKHINLSRVMLTDIIADSLIIKEASFKIFRDLSYPRDKIVRVGTFPQQLLMKMPVWLSIKKVIVGDAFIEYKEKNPKSEYSGHVQFTHASAVIDNVTNETALIKKDNHCIVNFRSRFLDMAPMHARLDLLLNDPGGKFLFSGGTDDPFAANNLNVLMQPMALAQVEKGNVNKLSFNFTGHNKGSDGKVILLYDDLKLSLLKKDSADDTLKKKKLASFVANILVKNANPLRKQPVRVADIHYERDTNRSFFNLMWKSIYAGIKKSAGM